jgi:hypothetical protein
MRSIVSSRTTNTASSSSSSSSACTRHFISGQRHSFMSSMSVASQNLTLPWSQSLVVARGPFQENIERRLVYWWWGSYEWPRWRGRPAIWSFVRALCLVLSFVGLFLNSITFQRVIYCREHVRAQTKVEEKQQSMNDGKWFLMIWLWYLSWRKQLPTSRTGRKSTVS